MEPLFSGPSTMYKTQYLNSNTVTKQIEWNSACMDLARLSTTPMNSKHTRKLCDNIFTCPLKNYCFVLFFFSNHRHRSESFWYTFKTINAQIRNVIICVKGSFGYVLFIFGKIQHRIAIIAELLSWSVSIYCLHEPFLLPLVDFWKALLDHSLWGEKNRTYKTSAFLLQLFILIAICWYLLFILCFVFL